MEQIKKALQGKVRSLCILSAEIGFALPKFLSQSQTPLATLDELLNLTLLQYLHRRKYSL